jgi:hypothetical protein
MGYKVIGTLKHDDEVFEHGDSVTADKVGGKDNLEDLKAAGTVVDSKVFEQLYPSEGDDEKVVNQPSGTPSNLGEVEGTKLQANPPEDKSSQKSDGSDGSPPNPATPPEVKGAGDPKAAAKEQEKKS